jgi:UDP-N-acetyl-D-mannosaminuronic acid dehydrogenase/UDP-N-acetyl-D-glucosamine dehydrogenase
MSVSERLRDLSTSTLVVVGQGYVGLPIAMRAVEVGYAVIGVDLDVSRIRSLEAGTSYVEDVPDATLQAALSSGRYTPMLGYDGISGFDYAIITVPTPLKESLPDLSFIESSAESLAPLVSQGATVVLESTTYPGTTEELLIPTLERGSGLTADKDFFVGYSPERIDPGNKTWGFVNTPKVVSGVGAASLEHVQGFYDTIVDKTVAVSGPKEAELTKLLENTFRHVNIALVNELAVFAHALGVDVWESINAASTKPFGFMKFTPGPGVGGHCLPVDPSYLSWQVRRTLGQSFRFVELANDVNEHMPDYVVQRVIETLNTRKKALNGAKVTVAGIAYKKNSGDCRESPALRIIELLAGYGAEVSAHDAHVSAAYWPKGVSKQDLTPEALKETDLLLVVTDHDDVDYDALEDTAAALDLPILDTRNRLSGRQSTKL